MGGMTDTARITGRAGGRIINDANVHTGRWHTIIVCEDAVFSRLEIDGVDVRDKYHITGLTYASAWCAPITCISGPDNGKRDGVFTLIQLASGIIHAYKDWV